MDLAEGQAFDRYVIDSLLGVGGMGRVYRAFDTRLRRAVALKILEPAAGALEAEVVAGALREARASAAIQHPNVTAVFDADRIGDTSFIVMELVPGTPLRRFIGDAVPVATRVRWLLEIAGALGAAHQAGVVHRDVKPENVLVRDDGVIKVLDFGIAGLASGGTPAHGAFGAGPGKSGMAGTPAYMAPEQIRSEPTDGRTDQFGWGVVAYELLSGRLPWRRALGAPYRLIMSVLSEKPEPFADAAGVPPEVGAAVLRALAKAPGDRFGSMGEVAAALAPFASLPPALVAAPPESRVQQKPVDSARAALRADAAGAVSAPGRIVRPAAASLPEPEKAPEPSSPPPPPSAPGGADPAFHAPDFNAPIDLDAHLALLPPDATCKGMFFNDALRHGAEVRPLYELFVLAGVKQRRYFPFGDYPMDDFMRLQVAVARAAHPGVALGLGLRRLGHTAFDTVLASQLGKTLFAAFGRDLDRMMAHGPRAYRLLFNFGEVSMERLSPRSYSVRYRDFPLFLESNQVGVIEGVLRHCGERGRLRFAADGLGAATILVELD
jgi:serine/threonine-protein kinase